ncbi:uncharacterized protein LOC130049913 [Ostrea edulis]|uniref:uncharacterized protein LOC130049913 n=1 Tax=Ostrea edulis TaxID=37623 RepID=UPI0024AFF484|nr:uncharacterized protein LOC130049913 [Ostrea edulis]
MGKGQPALLYLVPCTLGTTFVIGCLRGEARSLWAGISKQRNTAKPQSEINTGAPVTTAKSADQSSSDGSSDGWSESRLLINTRK